MTRIVHFSSAGGLFEGQRNVDSTSAPQPRRPYGAEGSGGAAPSPVWESLRRSSDSLVGVRPGASGHRSGLVSTLLGNGIRRELSSIYGSPDTLRDFVWADDVAEFVSQLVLDVGDPTPARTLLLASGRPSSIFEIQQIIEDFLGYKIYIGYSPQASNRDDITFSRSAFPSRLGPDGPADQYRRRLP
jgi:UDP-glucose 4-epimerase